MALTHHRAKPNPNGVAVRLSRTLMGLVHAILPGKRVCKQFLAETFAAAVHVCSGVTSKTSNSDSTSYHLWVGRKPDMLHLRVSSSKCWYTLEKFQTQKRDAWAQERMILDYAADNEASMLCQAEPCKVVLSKDVVFDELSDCANPENTVSG